MTGVWTESAEELSAFSCFEELLHDASTHKAAIGKNDLNVILFIVLIRAAKVRIICSSDNSHL